MGEYRKEMEGKYSNTPAFTKVEREFILRPELTLKYSTILYLLSAGAKALPWRYSYHSAGTNSSCTLRNINCVASIVDDMVGA